MIFRNSLLREFATTAIACFLVLFAITVTTQLVRFLGQVQPAVLYPGASWVVPFLNTVEEVDTRV